MESRFDRFFQPLIQPDSTYQPATVRYAAPHANFVLIGGPHNGLGARRAPEDGGFGWSPAVWGRVVGARAFAETFEKLQ